MNNICPMVKHALWWQIKMLDPYKSSNIPPGGRSKCKPI